MQEKGKKKIVDNLGGEKICKMKENPILMKEDLVAEARRKKRIHREEKRKREKQSLQEVELRLKKEK